MIFFFVNFGPFLPKNIPMQNTLPIDYIKNKAIHSLCLEHVNENEIKKLISSLKSNTSGYDMIGSVVLKWRVEFISEPLSCACNMSLQEGIFPDELKIANAIPLYKCDDLKLFNNYRPVYARPSASKLYERIMHNRLVAYLNEYKIRFSYQFGFRKVHSTYEALMTLKDKMTKCLDNDEYVIVFFLNFSKAFDAVENLLLIMVYHLILRNCNLEFLKVPFLDHFSFWLYKWSCHCLHFIFPYTFLQMTPIS